MDRPIKKGGEENSLRHHVISIIDDEIDKPFDNGICSNSCSSQFSEASCSDGLGVKTMNYDSGIERNISENPANTFSCSIDNEAKRDLRASSGNITHVSYRHNNMRHSFVEDSYTSEVMAGQSYADVMVEKTERKTMDESDVKVQELDNLVSRDLKIMPGEKGTDCSQLSDGHDYHTNKNAESGASLSRSSRAINAKGIMESPNLLLKNNESLNRGLQPSSKVPVVAFAQAAQNMNDLRAWPLMSPLKPQLHKCDKCSRQFSSFLNYHRHGLLHKRSIKADKVRCAHSYQADKDLSKERSNLLEFWNKLSKEDAAKTISIDNVEAFALVQHPGLSGFPQSYVKAGTSLFDIVQRKESLSIAAEDLLKLLDDATEGTFLCGGASSSVLHKDKDVGFEDKNLAASMAFLIEQKLVKAWMEKKDMEALHFQKALVEEEEAAQQKQAKLLERKRLKKLRQKELKGRERMGDDQQAVPDVELIDEDGAKQEKFEESSSILITVSSTSSVISSGYESNAAESPEMDMVTNDKHDENGFVIFSGEEDHQDVKAGSNSTCHVSGSPDVDNSSPKTEKEYPSLTNHISSDGQGSATKITKYADFKQERSSLDRKRHNTFHSSTFQKSRNLAGEASGSGAHVEGTQKYWRRTAGKQSVPSIGSHVMWTPKADVRLVHDLNNALWSEGKNENKELPSELSIVEKHEVDDSRKSGNMAIGERVASKQVVAVELDDCHHGLSVSNSRDMKSASLLVGSLNIPLGNYASEMSEPTIDTTNACNSSKESGQVAPLKFDGECHFKSTESNLNLVFLNKVKHEEKSNDSSDTTFHGSASKLVKLPDPFDIPNSPEGARENTWQNSSAKMPTTVKVWRAVGKVERQDAVVAEVHNDDVIMSTKPGCEDDEQTCTEEVSDIGGQDAFRTTEKMEFHSDLSGYIGENSIKKDGNHNFIESGKDGNLNEAQVTARDLANFLSKRWYTAVETHAMENLAPISGLDGPIIHKKEVPIKRPISDTKGHGNYMDARIWPVNEEQTSGFAKNVPHAVAMNAAFFAACHIRGNCQNK